MATHCAQVETTTSMKGLRRAYKVLLNDYKIIRLHQAEAAALPAGAPPLAPLTLDAHPSLGPELTELLADNRSTEEETAKSIRIGVDELIHLEKMSIARSCALVYASLSLTVHRDASSGFAMNVCIASFRRFRGILPATNKNMQLPSPLRQDTNGMEKLEGRPLSDSHLASALLAALPECIAPNLFVWRGAQSNIPYKNIRQLREKHWQGLVTKYPHYLSPAPIAAAAPVHGSATATATTVLAHWHFRPFAMAQASETATDKRPPHPGAPKAKTPWRIGVLSRAFHQNAVRQDFVFPPGWAAIPPPVANATAKAAGVVEEPIHPSSTPLAKATHPAVNPVTSMGQGGHASLDYGVYRDDHVAIARFVSQPPAIAVRSGDRYRDNSEDRVYCRNDRGPFPDDSGANQNDQRHRSRRAPRLRPTGIHPPAHPKPQCVARHCPYVSVAEHTSTT
ncbi:hypothetical protein H257_17247 [Aphanomyces astaci]|uniref:Uncharacterized protein n=1 Tax=Aphanomyces astaci TaxID=112090 RepID=W4FHE0_APHAT|nr:hypothetical protein H257_17247 [Aphanomyces astaci]ETV66279.1 hypothetical protein H257_17247 [Aphanomyces astaci]|eukprot:XP_009844266.1 hypothetical protein H257_17247 [Aphanomyces astaci]